MRTSIGTALAIALIALVTCCRSAAAEQTLFRATDFVSRADEAALFTAQEKKSLSLRREGRFIKQVLVTKFNRDALLSPTISLEMPDHNVYRFSGAVRPGPGVPDLLVWTTETKTEPVQKSAVPASGPTVTLFYGGRPANSLELAFDRSRASVGGTLFIGSRRFDFLPLGGQYLTLLEIGLNPSSPPIDAEQEGPHPARQRAGPDWPRGLLTEKLRQSLATSSIGASLSPQRCNKVISCGAVTMISCHPETDGAEMFFDNVTGSLIMACGGSCMQGAGLPGSKVCTACPPPEWGACKGSARDTPK